MPLRRSERLPQGVVLKPWAERTNLRRRSAQGETAVGGGAVVCLVTEPGDGDSGGRDRRAARVQPKRRRVSRWRVPGAAASGDMEQGRGEYADLGRAGGQPQRPLPSPPCPFFGRGSPSPGPALWGSRDFLLPSRGGDGGSCGRLSRRGQAERVVVVPWPHVQPRFPEVQRPRLLGAQQCPVTPERLAT